MSQYDYRLGVCFEGCGSLHHVLCFGSINFHSRWVMLTPLYLQGAGETSSQLPLAFHSQAGDHSVHGANVHNRRNTLYIQHAQQQLSSAGGPHEGGKAVRGSNAAAAALGLVQVCFQIFSCTEWCGVRCTCCHNSSCSDLNSQARLYAASSWCVDRM